jgi:hypothetical protein
MASDPQQYLSSSRSSDEQSYVPHLDDPISPEQAEGSDQQYFVRGTLANLRRLNKGPAYFRPPGSRRIFYTRRAIFDWIKSQQVVPQNGRAAR